MELPEDIIEICKKIGKAQWAETEALDADGHAENTRNSFLKTQEYFEQEGPQKMQFLVMEGTGVIMGYIGTSPNSAAIAKAMTGAWNRLVEECEAQ